MKQYRVKITFEEQVLGTVPKNQELYASYVASKAALTDDELAEELESVENVEERGWTGFHTIDGQPYLLSYACRGFFKEACYALRLVKGSESKGLRAYKKRIDLNCFIRPKRIPLILPEGAKVEAMEHPLRAQTPQGERVALARSDTVPAGTTMEFTVHLMGEGIAEEHLREWLDYGEWHGFGQWRSSGIWGTFTYEMEEVA